MAALALSNGEHGLLYPSVTETTLPGGQHVVRFGRGPLFLVAVAWGYSLLLASSLMVLRTWRSAQGEERGHWLGFLMISAVPWASNLGYVVFDLRLFGSDPTPISFALAAGGFAWLIRAKRLFDVVPMARHLLFAELPDPVLILDSSGRVMEANNAARQLAGLSSSLGRPLAQWPGLGAQIAERLATPDTGNLLSPAGSPSIYELRVAPIGRDGRQIGRLLQLHDVTEQQHAQARMVQTLAERNSQLSQVAALQDELREQALRDPLTGLHNRRALEQRFAQEAEYHGTTGQPLALVAEQAGAWRCMPSLSRVSMDVEVAHRQLADAVGRREGAFDLLHAQPLGLVGEVGARRCRGSSSRCRGAARASPRR
jgi:PAS domain-containing protein